MGIRTVTTKDVLTHPKNSSKYFNLLLSRGQRKLIYWKILISRGQKIPSNILIHPQREWAWIQMQL